MCSYSNWEEDYVIKNAVLHSFQVLKAEIHSRNFYLCFGKLLSQTIDYRHISQRSLAQNLLRHSILIFNPIK